MRVLHVDSGSGMRGGQWQSLALVEALGRDAVLLAVAGTPIFKLAASRNIDVQPLTLRRIAQLSGESDLLHAHDARSHTWSVSLARAPVIVSRRVAFPIHLNPVSRWKYGRPARFIAVSDCVRRMLVEGGVADSKIDVVYDGVAAAGSVATPERIVALDSADPRKMTDLLRAAASSHFDVQFSSDLERDLLHASVFVYLTDSEGLGSAALMAMARGVPVVASRVGGLLEVVQDGVNGVLTENDIESIRTSIRRALSLRAQLSSAALATVAGRFTLGHMVTGTREVYRKVLGC